MDMVIYYNYKTNYAFKFNPTDKRPPTFFKTSAIGIP